MRPAVFSRVMCTTSNDQLVTVADTDLTHLAAKRRHSTNDNFFLCRGADLAALVREACMAALRECINARATCHVSIENQASLEQSPLGVGQRHFSAAFQKVKPSVSKKVGI